MLKSELEEKVKELEQQVEDLTSELQRLDDCYRKSYFELLELLEV